MSERGERGPHGDHGQTGDTGQMGLVGPAGPTGPEGPRGRSGSTSSSWLIRNVATAYALVVIGVMGSIFFATILFELSLARTTQNGRDSRYVLCQHSNRIASGIRQYLRDAYPNPNRPDLPPERAMEIRAKLAYAELIFADANCQDVIDARPPSPLPPSPVVTTTSPPPTTTLPFTTTPSD